jgi:hypothetical protein
VDSIAAAEWEHAQRFAVESNRALALENIASISGIGQRSAGPQGSQAGASIAQCVIHVLRIPPQGRLIAEITSKHKF